MADFIRLLLGRIEHLDFSSPLTYIDLFVAACLIIAFLLYMRRFPVFRVMVGALVMLMCSAVLFVLGLTVTALLFGWASLLILVALPLIFAPEIRHYLEKIGRFSYVKVPKLTSKQRKESFIRDLVEAVFELAERKTGALIVIERKTGLGETIETGELIDARLNVRLLENIFYPKSPLHDGAVILVAGRIMAAGCLLPITSEVRLHGQVGTRHRSGVAVTRDTDALVLIVSEERGEVSLAENATLHQDLSRADVTEKLRSML